MKLRLTIMIFCYNFFFAFSQNSNSLQAQKIDIEKLASLCKVWGFLKYYHPNVANGTYNWDDQLLTIIPKVEKAESKDELSKIYLDWIKSLGEVKLCKSCDTETKKKYFDKNFDLSWTQDNDMFSADLSKVLKYIQLNRFQGKNHYVAMTNSGNIEVKNETEYKDFEFPEQNLRLLSLFKYWNTVEYFFPYKYQTDQNWNAVLSEMIIKFKEAKNKTEYQLALLETVVKLDDTHATFYSDSINAFFGRKCIPAAFKIIDEKAVITEFYDDSLSILNDLRIGDVVEKVDEKSIGDILKEKLKYISGSNYKTKLRNAYWLIFNGPTDSVKISLNRNGVLLQKMVGRYLFKDFKQKRKVEQKYKILEGNIGYVNMSYLHMKDVEKMMLEMESTNAIILDYREFLNFTPYVIARRLIQARKDFVKFIEPDLSYPGRFTWKMDLIDPMKNKYYGGKVIVLVNEETQSSSEYATMLLQVADKVKTIGSQTAGADGNVSQIEFLGFKSKMSGLGVFYPDETETQRKGVKIDIEVLPTIKAIQEGKDEVLEKALEYIKK